MSEYSWWVEQIYVYVQASDHGETFPSDFKVFTTDQINKIDLIVCFGGDGTVLHTASLFPGPVPPMLPVAMGSLGFMTPFTPATAMVGAVLLV